MSSAGQTAAAVVLAKQVVKAANGRPPERRGKPLTKREKIKALMDFFGYTKDEAKAVLEGNGE